MTVRTEVFINCSTSAPSDVVAKKKNGKHKTFLQIVLCQPKYSLDNDGTVRSSHISWHGTSYIKPQSSPFRRWMKKQRRTVWYEHLERESAIQKQTFVSPRTVQDLCIFVQTIESTCRMHSLLAHVKNRRVLPNKRVLAISPEAPPISCIREV
jgi:hypothetical protein